jgi:ATP-dependent helicase HrpB
VGDLTSLALELLAWGVSHPRELLWPQTPSDESWSRALASLRLLGAVEDGEVAKLTEFGRAMVAGGTHPRFAAMLLHSVTFGWQQTAADLIARLVEAPRVGEQTGTDVERLWSEEASNSVRKETERLLRWSNKLQDVGLQSASFSHSDMLGILLAWAFPDRIGQSRPAALNHDPEYLYFRMANGRGCKMKRSKFADSRPWLVVVEASDEGADAVVRLSAQMSEQAFAFACADRIVKLESVEWDDVQQLVRAVEQIRLGEIVVREHQKAVASTAHVLAAWQEAFRRRGLRLLNWDRPATQLLQRMRFVASLQPGSGELNEPLFPALDEASLIEKSPQWLGSQFGRCRTVADLQKLDLIAGLRSLLDYRASRMLDEWAPTHWTVPSGSRIPIDYGDMEDGLSGQAPVLAVRLQEMFGATETPKIADGRVPLVLHLLSPAQRPIQVTQDLHSFWKNTYPEVRKELRGRYPKHVWPENPFEATPTARAKPRPK